MEQEIWKVYTWPDGEISDYEISSIGNVRRYRGGTGVYPLMVNLKHRPNYKGYPRITLCRGSKLIGCIMHRMVACTFLEKAEGQTQVNHKDGNKANNSIQNLEWCTGTENMRHAFEHGLNKGNKGLKSGHVKPVMGISLDGTRTITFRIMSKCVEEGFLISSISTCASGRRRMHKGFTWSYL